MNILVRCEGTDDVPVLDDNIDLTEEELVEYMTEADLEKHGFERTAEISTGTDENGKKTSKRTVYYKRTDDCSRMMVWESILEQRLPEKLRNSKIFSTTVKEIESRIAGRKTRRCTIIVELRPIGLVNSSDVNSVSKRGYPKGCFLWWCNG